MDKTIYLTRHCEAEHNVDERWHIPDANLTSLGRQQAKALNETTKNSVQDDVELVASSPLR
jgi:broad specificity phosphatase PhoE